MSIRLTLILIFFGFWLKLIRRHNKYLLKRNFISVLSLSRTHITVGILGAGVTNSFLKQNLTKPNLSPNPT